MTSPQKTSAGGDATRVWHGVAWVLLAVPPLVGVALLLGGTVAPIAGVLLLVAGPLLFVACRLAARGATGEASSTPERAGSDPLDVAWWSCVAAGGLALAALLLDLPGASIVAPWLAVLSIGGFLVLTVIRFTRRR